MPVSILPKTSPGRWSISLAAISIVLSVLLFIFGIFLFVSAIGGLEINRIGLFFLILAIALDLSGIGSIVTGLISVIKKRERAILVFLAMLMSLFTLIGITSITIESVF